MLFMHPMWDNESQRIGMQKCTPAGYALHSIGELVGFIGLLTLIAVIATLGWKLFRGTFHASLLWWIALPLTIGIISELMVAISWRMARKRGFHYDYDKREASWTEAGERHSYKYEPPN